MKSRIRRISNSVDISFGGPSNTTTATATTNTTTSTSTVANSSSSSTISAIPVSTAGSTSAIAAPAAATSFSSPAQTITKTQSTDFQLHHNTGPAFAGMSLSNKHSSQDSALGTTLNNSSDQPIFFSTNFNNSRSLDMNVSESRIEKMRKLLSSPLLRKRNPGSCNHANNPNNQSGSYSGQCCTQNAQQITRDANSSPSSSPSSSPALLSTPSLRTFGVSLESLSHHQHPHHQQSAYGGQTEGKEFYYRDPEMVIVPHQKAAHILGKVCVGCLTYVPSNSSSMGSIHESAPSAVVQAPVPEDAPPTTSSPNTSSSSTTSSTSSVHCGPHAANYLIPFIVTRLCNYIEIEHGLTHEGLFRVSGNAKLVERLKKSFDETGDAPLEEEADLGSATTLLKQFLRELPNPLIPNGPQFLDVLRSLKNDHDTCVLALKSLVSQLPDENYFTLRYLMRFLHRIDLRNDENRMSATNLGIVFAPNLFRVCVDTYQGLKDQSTANEVVHLLITEFMEIFGDNFPTVRSVGLTRDDMSVDLSACPFRHEAGKDNNDDGEAACTRSLIDFRAQGSTDLDKKRKDYQSGFSKRANVEEYYDTGDAHPQQRSQSVELGMDQFSSKAKTDASVGRTSSVRSTSGPPSSLGSSSQVCADIIVTNSTESISTDDNTATTAISTGATVCSVLGGSLALRPPNPEPGSSSIRHHSCGDETHDKTLGPQPMRTVRSGSCSSDSTDNQNLKISFSDEDGSLSRSIASPCHTEDEAGDSDNTSSENLDEDSGPDSTKNIPTVSDNDSEVVDPARITLTDNSSLDESRLPPTLLDGQTETPSPSGPYTGGNRAYKRFSSIRRKLKQFENDFKQETGFEPSYHNKMASSFARPLMLELSSILNVATSSLRDIDIDAADPSKVDHYREVSPTRSLFNARQQPNKRFPSNWRGPGSSTEPSDSLETAKSSDSSSKPSTSAAASKPGVASTGGAPSALTKEEIFNTIFGKPSDRHQTELREIMAEIQLKLSQKRIAANRPKDLEQMTPKEIQEEKFALQKALLRFEACYGRPKTREDRDIVRPVYDRYRAVKQKAYLSRFDIKNLSGQTSSDSVPQNELAPIIENVQMNFKSRNVPNKSSSSKSEYAKQMFLSPTKKGQPLNYHAMSQEELEEEYNNARQQRRNVKMILRNFEREFLKRTGRPAEREDRCNMLAAYSTYKTSKAKSRLLKALLKKTKSESEQPNNEPKPDKD